MGPRVLDTFPKGAPGAGDVSKPGGLGDAVGVERSDKIAPSGAKSGVARRREAAISLVSYHPYSGISTGDFGGVIG